MLTSTIKDVAERPRRRTWLIFSLRTLLVIIALFSAWLAYHVNRVSRQEAAVAAIAQLGGRVRYDWEPTLLDATARMRQVVDATRSGQPSPMFIDAPRVPQMLRNLFGDRFFQAVVEIDVRGNVWTSGRLNLNDAVIEHVVSCKSLERLSLVNTDVSDVDLQAIGRLKQLRFLILRDSHITDASLMHLNSLHQLELLNLVNTEVTKEGAARLREQLPHCTIQLEDANK
jgi:hypothetical protein